VRTSVLLVASIPMDPKPRKIKGVKADANEGRHEFEEREISIGGRGDFLLRRQDSPVVKQERHPPWRGQCI
jgi:hypothetical protein